MSKRTNNFEDNQDNSYALNFKDHKGIDCRRIQMFGLNASKLQDLVVTKAQSSQELMTNPVAVKELPSRIVIRKGAINDFLDTKDQSTFDVAMFFEGNDVSFEQVQESMNSLRTKHKGSSAQSINQNTADNNTDSDENN